jgi:hypothetical protein
MLIHQMLADGRITPQQAGELIDAIEGTEGPSHVPAGHWGHQADRSRGRRSITLDRLKDARAHGVTREFIDDLKAEGVSGLSLDELIYLRDHGVTADYIRSMREAGYGDLSPEQLVELRDHGVDSQYMRELEEVLVEE